MLLETKDGQVPQVPLTSRIFEGGRLCGLCHIPLQKEKCETKGMIVDGDGQKHTREYGRYR